MAGVTGDEPVTRRELGLILSAMKESTEMWRIGHAREHELGDIARLKAEREMTERLTGMNELRSQIDRERGKYIDRDFLEARINVVQAEIAANEKAIGLTNQSIAMLTTRVMVASSVLVVVFGAIMALANFFFRK